MNKLELQSFIFEEKLTRRKLTTYKPVQEKNYTIQVFRNHAFEMIEHSVGVFLDYAGIGINFVYSGYDDSFSFLELDDKSDMVIVFVDATRYTNIDLQSFLAERFNFLHKKIKSPILAIIHGFEFKSDISSVVVYSLEDIKNSLGEKFLDERAKDVTGTALSSATLTAISKDLGLKYLPAMLKPLQKAIVVDLDNTLYSGVLGEDGVDGVVLTDGHKELQNELKRLSSEGFFLAICSKNNLEDVEIMLENRCDFPLKKSDFAKICASWDEKANSITEIASYLNIHQDSMVFIDDNIGELTAVSMIHPSIKIIHAKEDAKITANVLASHPGFLKLRVGNEDFLRTKDMQAKAQRVMLKANLSNEEYIRSLELKLDFEINNKKQSQRIYELANKTNQFIFNYARYEQASVEDIIDSNDYCVVSISLSDKLSDSGLIGVCVGKKIENYVSIQEIFISCRALGRGIDDIIVLGAIKTITEHFQNDLVKVEFKKGPRNEPAEIFLKKYLSKYLTQAEKFSYEIPKDLIKITYNRY